MSSVGVRMASAARPMGIALLITVLAGTAILRFLSSLLISRGHDWDLDAFLYIGSRLRYGELLFLKDFETKLPAVQYLFAVADALGGIGSWRIMTFAGVMLAGVLASRIAAKAIAGTQEVRGVSPGALGALGAAVFLSLLYALPGAEAGHLGMLAAAGAYAANAVVCRVPEHPRPHHIAALAGALLGGAALIRPNYLYVLPAMLLAAGTLATSAPPLRRTRAALGAMIALVMGFGGVVLLSFVPYLFVEGGVAALRDGMAALGTFGPGMRIRDLWAMQMDRLTAPFALALYGSYGALVLMPGRAGWMRSVQSVRDLWLPVLSIAGISLSVLRTYYWNHNMLLLVPYAMPLILRALAEFFRVGRSEEAAGVPPARRLVAGCVVAAFVVTPVREGTATAHWGALNSERLPYFMDWNINHRRIDDRLLAFLRAVHRNRQTFLVVDHPGYHTVLGEPRVGDGHPYMLLQVLRGQRIGPIGTIPLYSERVHRDPCLALAESGKDLIVMASDFPFAAPVIRCLERSAAVYRRMNASFFPNYIVYMREQYA